MIPTAAVSSEGGGHRSPHRQPALRAAGRRQPPDGAAMVLRICCWPSLVFISHRSACQSERGREGKADGINGGSSAMQTHSPIKMFYSCHSCDMVIAKIVQQRGRTGKKCTPRAQAVHTGAGAAGAARLDGRACRGRRRPAAGGAAAERWGTAMWFICCTCRLPGPAPAPRTGDQGTRICSDAALLPVGRSVALTADR